jgi:hypothetical protein
LFSKVDLNFKQHKEIKEMLVQRKFGFDVTAPIKKDFDSFRGMDKVMDEVINSVKEQIIDDDRKKEVLERMERVEKDLGVVRNVLGGVKGILDRSSVFEDALGRVHQLFDGDVGGDFVKGFYGRVYGVLVGSGLSEPTAEEVAKRVSRIMDAIVRGVVIKGDVFVFPDYMGPDFSLDPESFARAVREQDLRFVVYRDGSFSVGSFRDEGFKKMVNGLGLFGELSKKYYYHKFYSVLLYSELHGFDRERRMLFVSRVHSDLMRHDLVYANGYANANVSEMRREKALQIAFSKSFPFLTNTFLATTIMVNRMIATISRLMPFVGYMTEAYYGISDTILSLSHDLLAGKRETPRQMINTITQHLQYPEYFNFSNNL